MLGTFGKLDTSARRVPQHVRASSEAHFSN
jgi:hypothetical protein